MSINQLASAIASRDPLAARLQAVNARTGRMLGTGVERGMFYASETIGRSTSRIGEGFADRANCVAFIEGIAA